jgi:hypothetical protein
MNPGVTSLLPPAARTTLRRIAPSIVAATAALDAAGWAELFAVIEQALGARPARQRRQLHAFLRILELAALLRYGRPLARLDETRRTALLARFQDAPLLLLRRGFWGVRTLVLMGYYTQAHAADAIGYRASALGWDARP